MKRQSIKRMLVLLLCPVLLCLPLCACQSGGEKAPPSQVSSESAGGETAGEVKNGWTDLPQVNICVDLGTVVTFPDSLIPGAYKEFVPITEVLPVDGPDRENRLTSLRTEMMAGKGPDLFICAQDTFYSPEGRGQALFPFPDQAMENHIFLPLDEYIANAQYMEWDKQLPVLMEAGKNEEGQLIIPMLYEFQGALYPKEKYRMKEELPLTWEEAVSSGDPMVLYAAWNDNVLDSFLRVADYEKDELLFTEEELAERWIKQEAIAQMVKNGEWEEMCYFNEQFQQYGVNEDIHSCNNLFGASVDVPIDTRDYIWVPSYNDGGGVTARVLGFGAVNRNAAQPEFAFRVLDFLMSETMQSRSFILETRSWGMVPHMELGQIDMGAAKKILMRGMNQWNFQEFSRVREQINQARFYSGLDRQLMEVWADAEKNGAEDAIHRAYVTMQMMLAES